MILTIYEEIKLREVKWLTQSPTALCEDQNRTPGFLSPGKCVHMVCVCVCVHIPTSGLPPSLELPPAEI